MEVEGVEGVEGVEDPFEVTIEEDDTFSIPNELIAMFTEHTNHLRERREKRKRDLTLKPLVSTAPAAPVSSTSLAVVPDAEGAGERPQPQNHVLDADGEVDLAASVSFGPGDKFEGDLVLRRLNILLDRIDQKGFQRSRQQVTFHDAFIRATSRVMFKQNWQSSRPEIMRKYEWDRAPSEILISTPRRFGKTFS